jgi:hypothetical protein
MSTPTHITPTGTPGFISTPAIHPPPLPQPQPQPQPQTTTTNFTSEEVNITYPQKLKVINISKNKKNKLLYE